MLFKNKLIILLMIAIVLALIFRQGTEQLSAPVVAKQRSSSQPKVAATPAIKQTIIPNPDKLTGLKNPFKPLNEQPAINVKPSAPLPILTGIISQNNEFLAIIFANGKSDFYRPQQKIADYVLIEINSTSVVLLDEHSKKRLILHIKE